MSTLTPEMIAQLRAHDKDDLRTSIIVGNIFCIGVAFVSVLLRFWARRIVKTYWGADDWCSLAGMLITALYTACLFVMCKHNMGRHIWWLNDPAFFVKLALVAEVAYNAAIPVIKASILLLYHRIFPQRWLKPTLWGLGVFIVGLGVAQIFADIFQCSPVDSLWGASPKKYCINFPLLNKIGGSINILTDVAMLALPMPSLWKLNLSATRKRALIAMFLIGGIVCIASIIRLFYVNKIGNSQDETWDYGVPATIANVELCVGVLAANLPTYRPLFTSLTSNKKPTDTMRTSKAAGSYKPVNDSMQIPLSSLLFKKGMSNTELDDREMLAGNTEHKVQTHISNEGGRTWPGARGNEIRVTTYTTKDS